MIRPSTVGTVLAAAVCVLPAPDHAQGQARCTYQVVDRVSGYTQTTQTGESIIHHVSGGIDYRCPDGARILADSAVVFQTANRAELFGNVRFNDATTELVSRRAFYYGNNRQLNAWDDIRLVDRQNGAVITGDELVLYRAAPGRPLDRMVITGRAPHATVFLTEGGIESVVPYEVDAQRFTLEGRRFFRAGGGVVVDRATLHAVGDSLDFDQEVGIMSVLENARVQDLNFDLVARTVTVLTPEGLVEEVLARESAELLGDDVVLEAPAIRMFVRDNLVQRLVAVGTIPPIPTEARSQEERSQEEGEGEQVGAAGEGPDGEEVVEDGTEAGASGAEPAGVDPTGPGSAVDTLPQPSAVADDFHLWADSIDVRSPGQVLDRVIAVGRARSESITAPDSIPTDLPEVAQEDWMVGDTIVARFSQPGSGEAAEPDGTDPNARAGADSVVIRVPADSVGGGAASAPDGQGLEADTTATMELESVTAIGEARSLYKIAPTDSTGALTGGPPALHYVKADLIRIHFFHQEVVRMEVEGQTIGYHFEPTLRPAPPPPDTARGSVFPPGSTGRPFQD
ncbi:MAG: hypothetical protein HKN73_01250 [Gemmatimonadetes bacterium]|nr:hypothetical protein [Gemmatimonadota bacterium]